jgi:hypothetical protein
MEARESSRKSRDVPERQFPAEEGEVTIRVVTLEPSL